MHRAALGSFKPALISKGLRPNWRRVSPFGRCFKPALISKGLRRKQCCVSHVMRFQTSPDFKGIKTALSCATLPTFKFQTSPDFKGIKTAEEAAKFCQFFMFQTSPDFKGIKTCSSPSKTERWCFKPALIPKGLRPRVVPVVEEVYFQAQKPVKRHAAGRGRSRAAATWDDSSRPRRFPYPRCRLHAPPHPVVTCHPLRRTCNRLGFDESNPLHGRLPECKCWHCGRSRWGSAFLHSACLRRRTACWP